MCISIDTLEPAINDSMGFDLYEMTLDAIKG